jgi:hypothetical protein
MQVKIHNSYRAIVSLADSDLIGKTFEEGIKIIEVKASFYQGEEKTKEEVVDIIKDFDKEDATFNIVGDESINVALEAGIINKEGIMKIDNIPIALGLF